MRFIHMHCLNLKDCSQFIQEGETPIIRAATYGHTDIVEKLLSAGADFDKCDMVSI